MNVLFWDFVYYYWLFYVTGFRRIVTLSWKPKKSLIKNRTSSPIDSVMRVRKVKSSYKEAKNLAKKTNHLLKPSEAVDELKKSVGIYGICKVCPRRKNRKTKKTCVCCDKYVCTEHAVTFCEECRPGVLIKSSVM